MSVPHVPSSRTIGVRLGESVRSEDRGQRCGPSFDATSHASRGSPFVWSPARAGQVAAGWPLVHLAPGSSFMVGEG